MSQPNAAAELAEVKNEIVQHLRRALIALEKIDGDGDSDIAEDIKKAIRTTRGV